MAEQVSIKPWGNSQGIRIPKKIMEQVSFKTTDILQMEVIDNAVVIRKKFIHKTFEERVAEYNGNISVVDFDWGEPQGKEIL